MSIEGNLHVILIYHLSIVLFLCFSKKKKKAGGRKNCQCRDEEDEKTFNTVTTKTKEDAVYLKKHKLFSLERFSLPHLRIQLQSHFLVDPLSPNQISNLEFDKVYETILSYKNFIAEFSD